MLDDPRFDRLAIDVRRGLDHILDGVVAGRREPQRAHGQAPIRRDLAHPGGLRLALRGQPIPGHPRQLLVIDRDDARIDPGLRPDHREHPARCPFHAAITALVHMHEDASRPGGEGRPPRAAAPLEARLARLSIRPHHLAGRDDAVLHPDHLHAGLAGARLEAEERLGRGGARGRAHGLPAAHPGEPAVVHFLCRHRGQRRGGEDRDGGEEEGGADSSSSLFTHET